MLADGRLDLTWCLDLDLQDKKRLMSVTFIAYSFCLTLGLFKTNKPFHNTRYIKTRTI